MRFRSGGLEGGNSHLFRPPVRTRNQLGQAEIQHFCLATPGEENIGRLQVAMDDARLVGDLQSVSNLHGDVKNLSAGQWPTGDEVLEGLTFQELHHDEAMAFRFVNFVDSTNVGMVEGRGGACLALKSLEGLRIADQSRRQELDRYISAQP